MKRSLRARTLLILTSSLAGGAQASLPFAVQSDDADVASSFASGLVYDPVTERVTVVGSTYGEFFDPSFQYNTKLSDRDCFVARLQLPRSIDPRGPTWILKKSFGQVNVTETCTAIVEMRSSNSSDGYVLAGHAVGYPQKLSVPSATTFVGGGEASNNTQLSNATNTHLYGFGLELDSEGQLNHTAVFQSNATQFPVAITNDVFGAGFYLAISKSDEAYRDSAYETWLMDQMTLQPDPSVLEIFLPERMRKGYSTTLVCMDSTASKELWTKELVSTDGASVYVASLKQHLLGDLLVAGFSRGSGEDFGSVDVDGSFDGFVTRLDPVTSTTIRSMRLRSVTNRTDVILGLCTPTDPTASVLYVVGATNDPHSDGSPATPDGTFKAFLLQLDLETFGLKWSAEFIPVSSLGPTYPATAYGMACSVSSDNSVVYVAGTVKDGASVSTEKLLPRTTSAGQDDIFIAQVDVVTGNISYVRQIGTTQNDRLAVGESLTTDKDSNAIVLANTQGSFYRNKTRLAQGITNDIVLFSVSREDGSYVAVVEDPTDARTYPVEDSQAERAPTRQPTKSPLTASPSKLSPTKTPVTSVVPTPGWPLPKPSLAPGKAHFESGSNESKSLSPAFIVSIVLLVTLIAASCAFVVWFRHYRKRTETKIETAVGGVDGKGSNRQMDVNVVYFDGNLDQYADEIYHKEARSHTSGSTLRSSPRPKDLHQCRDTVLRLDPSGGSDAISHWDVREEFRKKKKNRRSDSKSDRVTEGDNGDHSLDEDSYA